MYYSAINQQKILHFHYTETEPSVMSPNKGERSTLELTGVVKGGREREREVRVEKTFAVSVKGR